MLETVNQRLVAEVAKTTAASLMRMATGPSRLRDLALARTATGFDVKWTAAPERNVRSYLVSFAASPGAPARTLTVRTATVSLPQLPAGTEIRIKAVDAAGNEGWDWARILVPAS